MTTLAKDEPRRLVPFPTDVTNLPVIAADIIFEGAAVGDNGAGHARPIVAGDAFRGFAIEKADNAAGAAAAIEVWLRTRGQIQLSVATAAIDDVGKPVFASDDDTFTLTQGTNSYIGRITRFVSPGVVIVSFDAFNPPMAEITPLIENSGDTTPDVTIADVSIATTATDGTTPGAASLKADVDARLVAIDSNFADLAAQINKLERMVRGK